MPSQPEYLKKAQLNSASDSSEVRAIVQKILGEIEAGGEEVARRYAAEFDRYQGNIKLGEAEIAAASAALSQQDRDDIHFAHANVQRFAEAQKATLTATECEIIPGFVAGQKCIPVANVGCYVPAGATRTLPRRS